MIQTLEKILTAAVLVALPNSVLATEAKPCLTSNEARSLIQVALPDVINTVVDKCKSALPTGAFLTRSGKDMATRYRSTTTGAWPNARLAFLKLAGPSGEMLKALPDDAAKGLISAGITAAMGDGIKADQCVFIDRAVAALAPLPPENLADLTIVFLEVGNTKRDLSRSPLTLCPAPTAIAGTAIVNKPTASAE
jgi:hypothetical protein